MYVLSLVLKRLVLKADLIPLHVGMLTFSHAQKSLSPASELLKHRSAFHMCVTFAGSQKSFSPASGLLKQRPAFHTCVIFAGSMKISKSSSGFVRNAIRSAS